MRRTSNQFRQAMLHQLARGARSVKAGQQKNESEQGDVGTETAPFDRSGTSASRSRGGNSRWASLPPASPRNPEESDPSGWPPLGHGVVIVPPRPEQPPDQLRPLEEPSRLGWSRGGEIICFDLFQHPRQRHREREQGSVQIGEVITKVL